MSLLARDNSKMTVREVVNRYVAQMKKQPDASFHSHADMMLNFFGRRTLGELCEPRKLADLCQEYNRERGRSPGTITKQLRVLQAALRWAWKEQLISGLPGMWLPGPGEPRDRNLTSDELNKILGEADKHPTRPHLRAFIYLTVFTGQYRDAVLSLTWECIDFKKNSITFVGPNNGKRVIVQMDARLRQVLMETEIANRPGCKFVVAHNGRQVANPYQALQAFLDRCGMGDVTLNDLRRFKSLQKEAPDGAESGGADEPHLFISYSSLDGKQHAEDLKEALHRLGRIGWVAHLDNELGVPYPGQLTRGIKECEALIVIVTPGAADSIDVVREVQKAHRFGKRILPIIVDETDPGDELGYFIDLPHQTSWTNASGTAVAILRALRRR